ncbi:ABC transporter substrate-binding protein [Neobacillus sp. OS1-32]|uniref:ABC transporter substrate-binding protein n=1 Tax=Neobacillus sp. OS1-32 TaxID=3070682 RepID=UPI0027E07BD9|nr:ABC transporter substrate-binding protein [Neobacillus sp. OS1-32]WML29649.1 ABC transporter substrate-binding protein [Neobacillus sp. OS1-32]
MLKKSLGLIIIFILLIVSAFGCSSSKNSTDKGKKGLVIVNWKDYGSDDPAVVKEFEKKYNVKITHQYMASEEELLTKLRTGGVGKIDLILPNASILPVAIKENLLEEIDTTKLSNYQYIFDQFKKLPENQKDNKVYAVPWVWGSTGLAYNSNEIKENVDTVNILWDKKYKGKIAFRDDFNDAVMTAALALGQNPNNPSDLNAIKKKLVEQKQLNRTYWKTGDEFSKLFAGKQITVGLMWSGQAAAMKKNGEPINYVIPKEGAIGWVDNWAIVKDSKNYDLAVKFIDYMLSKKFQEDWVKKGGPNPVNIEVTKNLDAEFVKQMGINEETIAKLHFISYHSDAEKKQWNEMWQEVKSQ